MTADTDGQMAGGRLVTVDDAAAALGVSDRTIRRYIRSGRLYVVKHGRQTLVRLDASGASTPARPMTTDTDRQTDQTLEILREAHRREVELLEARIADLKSQVEMFRSMLPGRVSATGAPWWLVVLLAGLLLALAGWTAWNT